MSFALKYRPDGQTIRDFMKSDALFRGIRGPVGSGKSVGCAIELFRRGMAQEPDQTNTRRTRWGVVRNTNPELRTTTIKTWLDWFPEEIFGRFRWSTPYTHHIKMGGLPDDTSLDMEVIFLALDRPEDVKKLLSLELTGIWFNEAREISKTVIDGGTSRIGRFPSMRDGGPTWYGSIADTNAPDEDHWWPIMSGEAALPEYILPEEAAMLIKPKDWQFYTQPAAMKEIKNEQGSVIGYGNNELRENGKFIVPKYYKDIIQGKTKTWIDVYVLNRLGSLSDGKPVYPEYNDEIHVAKTPIAPVPGIAAVMLGADFGLTPAAVIAQHLPDGRWLILDEIVANDMGAQRFAQVIKHELATKYPDLKMDGWGDPAGDSRAQTDENTPFKIMKQEGIRLRPTGTNDPVVRIGAVQQCLTRMVNGQPGFLISPTCRVLRQGFRGGYQYRRMKVAGEARYEERPNKNRFSHVHDALQYLLVGGGEGRILTTGTKVHTPVNARTNISVFDRQRKVRQKRSDPWSRRTG